MNLPPHANSAVDGYAFAHADLVPEQETVSSRPAGPRRVTRSDIPPSRATAVRIFTGAPMPEGTDTVMMQEDCVVEGERVRAEAGNSEGSEPASCRRGRRRERDSASRRAAALAGGSRSCRRPRALASCPSFAGCEWRCSPPATRSATPGTSLPLGHDLRRQPLYAGGAAGWAGLRGQRFRGSPGPRGGSGRYSVGGRAPGMI